MPSQTATQEAFAEASGEVWLVLLTIAHADLPETLRFVNNNEAITSNGENFIAYPFQFIEPDYGENGAGIGRIRIDNIDREIANTIRTLQTAPTITVQVILASDPNTIERELSGMIMPSASWDALEVSGDISAPRDHDEPGCSWRFTPAASPALF